MRAKAPASPSAKPDDATPVNELMYPSLMVVGVTPTSLALLELDEPVVAVVPALEEGAVVVDDVLFDELPHAVAAIATAAMIASSVDIRLLLI
jgi:hypothetical protein